jgi:hypothetical protein
MPSIILDKINFPQVLLVPSFAHLQSSQLAVCQVLVLCCKADLLLRISTPSPPDTKPFMATSRWKRPRLYLTVVALFLITSSVTYFSFAFLYLRGASKPLDAGGAYGALAYLGLMLITSIPYLILGNWAAVSLLRKKPRFLLAICIMLAWIALTSFVIYGWTPSFLRQCVFYPNPSDPCYESSYWQEGFWDSMFALVCGMFALLYKGRRGYIKTVRQVQ